MCVRKQKPLECIFSKFENLKRKSKKKDIMPRNRRSRQSFAPKTPSRSRSTYSFPILKNSELIACMPNLGIHMSESDLTSPEPEFVINVYETFVDLLAGVSKEELNQPQFVGLGELDHPELHEDSIPRLALYRAT